MSEFSWKDEIQARADAASRTLLAADDAEAVNLHQAVVPMERYLAERAARDEAVRQITEARNAAVNWCGRAQEYCAQRNLLLWCLAVSLGWALGATWCLLSR
jgi:hypothetical protein